MAVADPAERMRRTLVTPEGVDLGLVLGEASERAAAFLLDALIIGASLIVLTILCLMAIAAAGAAGPLGAQAVAIIWLLAAFVARNLYFVGFEMSPRAATPGKRLVGLRVCARNGGRLTADAVFARNAMRELEVYLPLTFLGVRASEVDAWLASLAVIWCGVFVLFPLFNRDRLRVGDLVAGTWVVKSPRPQLQPDIAARAAPVAAAFAFTQPQLDAYGVKELHVLEDVLRRSNLATLAAVADRIRRKVGWVRAEGETDWAFLDAYYAALRGRLEARLLLGRRRRDKYDLG
jgi:uncharacterized RDD family membrane protein YckC